MFSSSEAVKNIIKMAIEDPEEIKEWKAIIQKVNGFEENTEIQKLISNQIRIVSSQNKQVAETLNLLSNSIDEIKGVMVQMAENMEIIANVFTNTAQTMAAQLNPQAIENTSSPAQQSTQ